MTKAEAWEILNKFDVFCRIIATLDAEVAAKNISQISMSHCVGTRFKTVAEYIIESGSEELACHIYAVVYLTFSRARSVCDVFDQIAVSIKDTQPKIAEELNSAHKSITEICKWYLIHDNKVPVIKLEEYIIGKLHYAIPTPNILNLPPELNTDHARKILDRAVSIGLINANYSRKDWKQVSKSELHLFVLYAKTELKLGKRGWKPFEILWGTTYLQSGYSKITMDKEERIRRLFSDDVIRQAEKSI